MMIDPRMMGGGKPPMGSGLFGQRPQQPRGLFGQPQMPMPGMPGQPAPMLGGQGPMGQMGMPFNGAMAMQGGGNSMPINPVIDPMRPSGGGNGDSIPIDPVVDPLGPAGGGGGKTPYKFDTSLPWGMEMPAILQMLNQQQRHAMRGPTNFTSPHFDIGKVAGKEYADKGGNGGGGGGGGNADLDAFLKKLKKKHGDRKFELWGA